MLNPLSFDLHSVSVTVSLMGLAHHVIRASSNERRCTRWAAHAPALGSSTLKTFSPIRISSSAMFKQSIRALSSRRLFSVTPNRSNLISDLYVEQIKQFKPSPAASNAAEAVKKFQMPSQPAAPSDEVNADAVKSYEASDVETASAPSGSSPAAEEDWFVFAEEEEHH